MSSSSTRRATWSTTSSTGCDFDTADRIVLLDPAQDPPPAFNPLQGDDDDLVVDNIVSIFGKIFARHWGPRIDDILRSALLTLMQRANPMLTMVPPLLQRQTAARRAHRRPAATRPGWAGSGPGTTTCPKASAPKPSAPSWPGCGPC